MADVLRMLLGISLGVSAGFALAYAITLGALFDSLVRRARFAFFADDYAPFRSTTRAKLTYAVFVPLTPMVLAVASLIADLGHRAIWPQAVALLLFPPTTC